MSHFKRCGYFGVAFRRSESHYDVAGGDNCLEPWLEKDGEIKRGQRAFANDYRMDEFDRNVLRVSGVGAASKSEQAAAAQESLGHFTASFREAVSFARKKGFKELVAG
jgi:hypothetical protein